jgi:hypothetical protein
MTTKYPKYAIKDDGTYEYTGKEYDGFARVIDGLGQKKLLRQQPYYYRAVYLGSVAMGDNLNFTNPAYPKRELYINSIKMAFGRVNIGGNNGIVYFTEFNSASSSVGRTYTYDFVPAPAITDGHHDFLMEYKPPIVFSGKFDTIRIRLFFTTDTGDAAFNFSGYLQDIE